MAGKGIEAGKAYISLGLYDAEAAEGLERFANEANALSTKFAKAAIGVTAFGAALIAPFALGLKSMLDFGAAVDFSSQRLGIQVAQLARLQVIGATTGVTLETLEIGFKTIGERIVQVQQGSQDVAKAFERLGIDFNKYVASGDQVSRLLMLSEALSRIEDRGERAGLALTMLGEAGLQLGPFLSKGADELQRLVRNIGQYAATEEAITASRELRFEWSLLGSTVKALMLDLGASVSPLVKYVIAGFREMVVWLRTLIAENPNLAPLVAALGGLAIAGGALLGAAAGILKFAGAMAFATLSVWALVSALAGLDAALTYTIAKVAIATGGISLLVGGIAVLSQSSTVRWAITQSLAAFVRFLGTAVELVGKLIAMIPGLKGVGTALAGFGETTRVLGESYEMTRDEYNRRRNQGNFGNTELGMAGGGSLPQTATNFRAFGALGANASLQSLGGIGGRDPAISLEEISRSSEATARGVEQLRNELRQQGRIQPDGS
jgi:hypothetical protein